jgi:hypothetical protein
MKRYFFTLLIAFLSTPVIFGQLGVQINYHKSNFPVWDDVLQNEGITEFQIFNQQYQIALDFGFSLRQYRVEIYPGFAYTRGAQAYSNYSAAESHYIDFDLLQYGFFVRTQVYPFDLLSKKGMQCPSFYSGGDIFTKGWFISVQPEFIYSQKSLEGYRVFAPGQEGPISSAANNMIFGFGIGTGLDIGLSESFSLTPTIMYSFLLGEKWSGYSQVFDQPSFNDATAASFVSYGIRIGLWF